MTQKRSEETRRAIVATAVNFFGTRGYYSTTVRDIVGETGLTQGAFYHHFNSKEDVLLEIHADFAEYFRNVVVSTLARHDDPVEALRALVEELLVTVEKYQMEVAIYFQEQRFMSAETFASVRSKRAEIDELLRDFVAKGMKSGAFRRLGPTHIVVNGILGMCNDAYRWYRPTGLSAREIGTVFADMLVSGLAAPA